MYPQKMNEQLLRLSDPQSKVSSQKFEAEALWGEGGIYPPLPHPPSLYVLGLNVPIAVGQIMIK